MGCCCGECSHSDPLNVLDEVMWGATRRLFMMGDGNQASDTVEDQPWEVVMAIQERPLADDAATL